MVGPQEILGPISICKPCQEKRAEQTERDRYDPFVAERPFEVRHVMVLEERERLGNPSTYQLSVKKPEGPILD